MGGEAVTRPVARAAIVAAAVFVGCALGASAETWVHFPGTGAAVLFPPYAIVTAMLWRTEPRRWWIVLLAASAGSFLPHRLGGASLAFALLAELVNQLCAVLAALGLRRLAGRSGRLTSMREMVGYLGCAVFAAPCVAALAGAFLATRVGGAPDFGLALREWWLSNAITGLTLLPLLAIGPGQVLERLRRAPVRRVLEAAALLMSLLLAGLCLFSRAYGRDQIQQAHLYWAVPFLLWAAARFGLRATSGALLVITSMSVWGAIDGRGPFAAQSPAANLLELQVFLLAVSIPLLLLATLIEQQRVTAAALIESRRQYRSVVDDQTEMICRFRPDGTYTFANRAYGEAVGRRPGDLVGGNIWSLAPAAGHRSRDQLDAITPAAPTATRDVSVPGPGNMPRWLQWRDRGFFDDKGVPLEYQSVGRDVTERKQADDARREIQARRSVEAALREADRRKDEFLAMLGHELRNPLAPIAISLEILRASPPESTDAFWAREAIGRQLAQMTRLLDDLFDVSRMKQGKIRLRWGLVDVGRVIESAVEETGPLIDSFGHALVVGLPQERLLIRGDAARLTQVVANLLNNAAKYTDPGGRIEVAVVRDAHQVEISVRDNGIGIDASARGRIFELFSQLRVSGRPNSGLGIGLALVRRLVELHAGSVEARSEGVGRGSEMVVRLPIVAVPIAVESQSSAPLALRAEDGSDCAREKAGC